MEKKRWWTFLIPVTMLCVFMLPCLMGAWDKTKPSSSTSLRSSNPEILANWDALETAIAQDHTFATGSPDGKHTQITFTDPISTPSDVTNEGVVYTKDASSVVELHWKDESGNELQYTSDGNLFSSTDLIVTGVSTFNGSITLGAGDDLIGSATSDIAFNTDKFTVAGATGNTVVAGTLDVTGILTTTAASVLGDGSALAAATESGDGDRVIADKAYVDNQISTAWTTWTPTVTQSGTVTHTVNTARYRELGKLVIAYCKLTMTGAGTGANGIIVGGLPTAIAGSPASIGSGIVVNIGTLSYSCTVRLQTTTSVNFIGYAQGDIIGVTPNFALASGDIISFMIMYEIA